MIAFTQRRRAPHRLIGRRGFSLLELVVVLAILALLTGLVAGLGAWTPTESAGADDTVVRARREAIHSGVPVTVSIDGPAGRELITVLPDGRLVAAASLSFDAFTGRPLLAGSP